MVQTKVKPSEENLSLTSENYVILTATMPTLLQHSLYWLKRPYHFVKTGLAKGLVGQLRFGFPSQNLKIITITGTDGKTTTSTLIYHLLKSAGKKVGLISTVGAYINDRQLDTGLHVTAPDPYQLQKIMRQMVEVDTEYLVLEMTSHGSYQFRSWGVRPLVAGLTNITHEHLDYHLTYDNYLAAKSLVLQAAQTVVLNRQDQSFYKLKQKLNSQQQTILSYTPPGVDQLQQDSSEPELDLNEDLELEDQFCSQLDPAVKQAALERFPEVYNQANACLAVRIGHHLGLDSQQLSYGLATFPGVPGRMEVVDFTADEKSAELAREHKAGAKQAKKHSPQFQVIIDFAHTPNALRSVLTALRRQLKIEAAQTAQGGRLIAVFGCAGLRDKSKRPLMGRIGAKLADLVIFTAEDPRTENVWSIIRQMKEQLTDNHDKVISIADRAQAIDFALNQLAQPHDIVAILGKGPEKSMCIGKTEHSWSDKQQVLAAWKAS
jgi:UDP-N-acetylmuramoyl-L-alanyl-D-glutamate--2,6-diaminopimelate ligase